MKKTMFSKANNAFFLAALIAVSSIAGFASKASAAAISNGMAASYVIGQDDFETSSNDFAADGLDAPGSVVVDEAHNRLFIADTQNNRVLIYDISGGVSTNMAATQVLGQTNLTDHGATLTASTFTPSSIAYDADRQWLFVGDERYNRVLIFDVTSITNGEDAIYVLGQADFESSNSSDLSAAATKGPRGLAYDPFRKYLFVSQSSLRVTIFDVASVTNNEDAIYVLGQPDFETGNSAYNPDLGGMNYPEGISYDQFGRRLFVADSANNRVTIFDMASISNNEAPVRVLGQPDILTRQAGLTQSRFDRPNGVWYDAFNKRLYVADQGNNRVLMFNTASGITDGMNASNVLGQPDFTTGSANSTGQVISDPKGDIYLPCATCLASPKNAFVSPADDQVYVVDSNNRVLVFNIDNTNNGAYPPYFTYSGGAFVEAGANDGSVTGSLSISLYNDTFVLVGQLTQGVHYSITNAPAGLIPSVSVFPSGASATLTFSGTAAAHANAQDVGNVTLSFLSGALTNTANVAGVIGSSYNSVSVDFVDPAPSNNQNNNQNESAPSPLAGTTTGGSPLRIIPVNSGTLPSTGYSTSYATLRKGARGDLVKQLQVFLNAKGANPVLITDGVFGNGTQKAVRAFQSSQKLSADGIVGMKTWSALIK